MDCYQISEKLIDYIDLKLDESTNQEIKIHLEECEHCLKEYKELKKILNVIDASEFELPENKLQKSFMHLLENEKKKSIIDSESMPLSILKRRRLIWQIAAAILLLFAGFLSGYSLKIKESTTENQSQQLNEMQNDVSEMKRMMALSLLKDESASQRIKAVNYTEEISKPDDDVIDALIETLNTDRNTNVRLAAVYSLARFKSSNKVKDAFINTLNKQEDPMLQIVIINILVELEEVKAIDEIRKLLKNNNINSEVKSQAEHGIKVLS